MLNQKCVSQPALHQQAGETRVLVAKILSKSFKMMFFLFLTLILLHLSTGLIVNRVQCRRNSVRLYMNDGSSGNAETSDENTSNTIVPDDESPADKYKREKLAEIAERKAQEVFVTRSKLNIFLPSFID